MEYGEFMALLIGTALPTPPCKGERKQPMSACTGSCAQPWAFTVRQCGCDVLCVTLGGTCDSQPDSANEDTDATERWSSVSTMAVSKRHSCDYSPVLTDSQIFLLSSYVK